MNKIIALSIFTTIIMETNAQMAAPKCEKKPKELITHGDTRIDNYYWLNDYWLKGPDSNKVVEYLSAENKYFEEGTKKTTDLKENLYQEILGKIKQTDESLPYFYNGYWYITKTEAGKEYATYVRRKGTMEAKEELLADVNVMAKGHPYYGYSGMSISPNNTIGAYGVDTVSRRNYVMYFENLVTGEKYKDVIYNTNGNVVWANDNKTVFYTLRNAVTLRSEKVMKHVLGTDSKNDIEVFFEKDEIYNVGIGKSKSDKYIFIVSGSTLTSESQYIDADKPESKFKIFAPREKNILYDVEHYKDKFYITTNWNALNFKLMETPIDKTDKANWKDKIAHRNDVLLNSIDVFNDYLVLSERNKGLTQIRIIEQATQKSHYIDFKEAAYVAYPGFNPEFDTKVIRYSYQSMTTPGSTFEYGLDNKSKKLLKEQPVLGSFNKENYTTERVNVKAADGTMVPMSIVYKKGFKKDGTQPILLYAYGSYGASTDPSFSIPRLSLLDRGFAFAIAHIRGGQEMGRQWYEDGKMFKKKNTFTDFVNCGEWLVKNNYTSPKHLYANGGSAGGLLMGAIINLKPELWNGVVAAVPFVDVVTTMLDESIPLTTGEFDEWGNPKNKDSYFYMKSYSPYDNVEKKAYPNMLVTTGLHDSQVQYFEPAKWVAKLREMKTDNNKLYLYTNMSTGHGGSSGRFQRLREVARDYAFFLELEGIGK
jgi:oligopeptidase B